LTEKAKVVEDKQDVNKTIQLQAIDLAKQTILSNSTLFSDLADAISNAIITVPAIETKPKEAEENPGKTDSKEPALLAAKHLMNEF
jgi:hypothetical protein